MATNPSATAESGYRTAPLKTDKMPPGIFYIVGNEAAERFSYYGMNSVLVVFMTTYMMTASGKPDHLTEASADAWYHTFVSLTYFLPVLGAFLADAILGKYRTILYLSIVYCLGHFTLAINDTRLGLFAGLGMIALGAGGIKPCVSANVGDQFGPTNQHLLTKIFSWFYFSINAGAAFSTLLIPWLLKYYGPKWAFGTPGIFMVIATIIFWLGRKKIVHIPPIGLGNYIKEFANKETLKALGNLLIVVPFAAMFWALWQQNFSSWVIQAEKMNLNLFGHEWLPSQIQTVNPLFILAMLPLFSYVVYPAIDKIFPLTSLRKIGIGLFLVVVAFLIVAWIQTRIDAGQRPNIGWQILAFLVLTASEIMVSVTHLEFAYTQAPQKMKSLVMCTYLGAVSLGNVFTAAVNFFIQNPDGSVKLAGASYFFFFAGVMFVTALIFVVVAGFYRGKTYIQDSGETQAA
jgi:POT family proton-dependent oligopeptide transporter